MGIEGGIKGASTRLPVRYLYQALTIDEEYPADEFANLLRMIFIHGPTLQHILSKSEACATISKHITSYQYMQVDNDLWLAHLYKLCLNHNWDRAVDVEDPVDGTKGRFRGTKINR